MRVRPVLVSAVALCALAAPAAFSATPTAAPQVTDPAGDANGGATAGGPAADQSTAPVSASYADVVSILWAPDAAPKGKKPTGFTVTTTLSAPPVAPQGASLVYRMLGQVNGDATLYLGPVYYTAPSTDPSAPQSALRDNLGGATRLTKIDLPVIAGNTMTWHVPFSAVPKEFKLGTAVSNLYFEVREIESFQGQKTPDALPVVGGATGLAVGAYDNGKSTNSFKIG
jgi:hypothetical protein